MEILRLDRELEGGKYYEGNTNKNPVTPKQERIIRFIKQELSVNFTGSSSKQAYAFIQKYYNIARKKAGLL